MTDKPYIQVKGVGHIKKSPDTIIVNMKIDATDLDCYVVPLVKH